MLSFQHEMEDLGLDALIQPSELQLFASSAELLCPDDSFQDVLDEGSSSGSEGEGEEDILEKIIREVKLPQQVAQVTEKQQAPSAWSNDCLTFDKVIHEDPTKQKDFFNHQQKEESSLFLFPQEETSYPSHFPQAAASPSNYSDSSIEDTQALIDEMEDFLGKHEAPVAVNHEASVSQNDREYAEKILDALMKGEVLEQDANTKDMINSVSEVRDEQGNKVVIVIANDEQEMVEEEQGLVQDHVQDLLSPSGSSLMAASPAGASTCSSDDSDWSPVARTTKRTTNARRAPYNKTKLSVSDKKERKKLQNVVAARRYRDKKKSEQNEKETEEQSLVNKNTQLKEKLNEMEGEIKTLKKLMLELGLVTVKE